MGICKLWKGRLLWWCPGCEDHHMVPVQGDGAWSFNGDLAAPTLQPSVLCRVPHVDGERVCHAFVASGRIQFLSDCTHKLAGQTVTMESHADFPAPAPRIVEGKARVDLRPGLR